MLQYRTELCEYIRSEAPNIADGYNDGYVNIALLEYLNNSNLLLINTKTLVSIKDVDDMELRIEDDRGAGFHSKDCCRFDDCCIRQDLACVTCYVDYKTI